MSPRPTNLTEQVIALAKRPGGMCTADVPGYSCRQASQSAGRIAQDGRIFVARLNRKTMRYFGTAEEAAQWLVNMQASKDLPADHGWRGMRQFAKPTPASAGCTIDMSRAKFTRYVLSPLARHAEQPLQHRMPSDLPFVPRDGSMEFAAHPSRNGGELRYRDGRVEQVVKGAAS